MKSAIPSRRACVLSRQPRDDYDFSDTFWSLPPLLRTSIRSFSMIQLTEVIFVKKKVKVLATNELHLLSLFFYVKFELALYCIWVIRFVIS